MVSIIALVTTVITVSTSAARVQSRDQKRKADLSLVAASLEIYYSEHRLYPGAPTYTDGTTNTTPITTVVGSWNKLQVAVPKPGAPAFYPTYLNQWPVDPKGGTATYLYLTNAENVPTGAKGGTRYALDAVLEGNEEVTNSVIECQSVANENFWLSGTFQCGSELHYRLVSPR